MSILKTDKRDRIVMAIMIAIWLALCIYQIVSCSGGTGAEFSGPVPHY